MELGIYWVMEILPYYLDARRLEGFGPKIGLCANAGEVPIRTDFS